VLANAGIILGTAAMTRDIIRDTTRPARRVTPRREKTIYTKLTNSGKVRKISKNEYLQLTGKTQKRKSILDDPFGDW
jgi:hypothetical protein